VDKAPDAFRTISEVADDLDVPQHVLRFWETRFTQIKPMKRGGGRRYYRPDDVDLLRGIRHLLYGEGYTIRGVQRILKDHGTRFVQSVWREGAPQPPRSRDEAAPPARPPAAVYHPAPSYPPAPPRPAGALHDRADIGRGRGLFGVLPSLLSGTSATVLARESNLAPRPLPPIEDVTDVAGADGADGAALPTEPAHRPERAQQANEAHSGRFAREEVQRLQSVLYELGECRRLLDSALEEPF